MFCFSRKNVIFHSILFLCFVRFRVNFSLFVFRSFSFLFCSFLFLLKVFIFADSCCYFCTNSCVKTHDLTHWARFLSLRKFFQRIILMGKSLLVTVVITLFVIVYGLMIVPTSVLSHNESSSSSNWDYFSQFAPFLMLYITYARKRRKIPSFSLLFSSFCYFLYKGE